MKLRCFSLLVISLMGIACKQKEFIPPQNKEYTKQERVEMKKQVLVLLAQKEKELEKELNGSRNNTEVNKLHAFVIERKKQVQQELNELQN